MAKNKSRFLFHLGGHGLTLTSKPPVLSFISLSFSAIYENQGKQEISNPSPKAPSRQL